MMHAKKHTLLWLAGGLFFTLLALWIVISGLSGNVIVTDPDLIQNTADSVMTNLQSGNWNSYVYDSPGIFNIIVSRDGILYYFDTYTNCFYSDNSLS